MNIIFMRMSECHPDRKHYGRGLCQKCLAIDNAKKLKAKDPILYREKQLKSAQLRYKKYPHIKLLYDAKKRAKRKNIEYNIEPKDVIIPIYCPIFGLELTRGEGRTDATMSLDRIDPSKGYIKGNVWIISYRANTIKNNATPEELIKIANAVKIKLEENNNNTETNISSTSANVNLLNNDPNFILIEKVLNKIQIDNSLTIQKAIELVREEYWKLK